jgi:hypothetical protein
VATQFGTARTERVTNLLYGNLERICGTLV